MKIETELTFYFQVIFDAILKNPYQRVHETLEDKPTCTVNCLADTRTTSRITCIITMQIVVVEIPTMIRSKLAPAKGFKFVEIQEQCQLYGLLNFVYVYDTTAQYKMQFHFGI